MYHLFSFHTRVETMFLHLIILRVFLYGTFYISSMIFLLTACGIYFFLHSFLANESVKQKLAKGFRLSANGYRKGYNLFNALSLGLLVLLLYKTESPLLYPRGWGVTVAGAIVAFAGSVIMFLSVKNYDLPSFFGFRSETRMPLQIKGLNKYMRHPLYSGTIVLVLGFCIALPYIKDWLFLALMIVYIFIGMQYEERKLLMWFGDDYKNYQQKVKRLIPGVL